MEKFNYSETNDIYLVAQVNENEPDYNRAIKEAKKMLIYRTKKLANQTCKLANKHNIEPGYKWVACKAHVYTESKLQLDNAQLI